MLSPSRRFKMIIPVSLGKDSYEITLERGALANADKIFKLDRKALIVTDSGVPRIYAEAILSACKEGVIVTIEQGETSKNLGSFELLCKTMLDNNFTRRDCVVAVGGGVAGDLAGFAAACFMRGIDFYNVPTTLLSQVDSSVGGKTAVDFGGIKNIIGAFHQPKAVLIDPDVLNTLSRRQFACGMAEAIKMAFNFDKELFEYIEKNGEACDIETVIAGALKIKAGVVEQDEKESGLRRALNFGHTLGHGIESVSGLLHGECVALGMLPMTAPALRGRLAGVLEASGLPISCDAQADKVIAAAMHDKKAQGSGVLTVRADGIGKFRFEKNTAEELLKDYVEVFK